MSVYSQDDSIRAAKSSWRELLPAQILARSSPRPRFIEFYLAEGPAREAKL